MEEKVKEKQSEKQKWFQYNIILFMINIIAFGTGLFLLLPLCILPFTGLAQCYALLKYFGE